MRITKTVALFVVLTAICAVTSSAQLPLRDSFPVPDVSGGAAVGDLNGDGFDDVGFTSSSGKVQIISGFDGAVIHHIPIRVGYDSPRLAGGGDVNADGVPDFVVGFPFFDNPLLPFSFQEGRIEVYSGVDASLIGVIDNNLAGHFTLGRAIAILGDLNGDGHAEFGAADHRPQGAFAPAQGLQGNFRVYDGATLNYMANLDTSGGAPGNIASILDVDGDGIKDIATLRGVHENFGTILIDRFQIRVFSGASLGLIVQHSVNAPVLATFGSIASAGDVNNDGIGDIVVGNPNESINGVVRVRSGHDLSEIYLFAGAPGTALFGSHVASAGDVNQDGHTDIVASTTALDGGFGVFSGVDGSVIAVIAGHSANATNPGEGLGRYVGLCGDLNGDGFPELFASAEGPTPNQMEIFTFGGEYRYGASGSPIQSLAVSWESGPIDPAEGAVVVTGGFPGASGIMAVSLNFANTFSGVFPVFIDTSPAFLDSTPGFGFDINGELHAPVNIRAPMVAGTSFYLQAFAFAPVFAASNGLQLLTLK